MPVFRISRNNMDRNVKVCRVWKYTFLRLYPFTYVILSINNGLIAPERMSEDRMHLFGLSIRSKLIAPLFLMIYCWERTQTCKVVRPLHVQVLRWIECYLDELFKKIEWKINVLNDWLMTFLPQQTCVLFLKWSKLS